MIPCPKGDHTTDSGAEINKQVAELLTHYDDAHGEELPDDTRELIRACARALGGARV